MIYDPRPANITMGLVIGLNSLLNRSIPSYKL